MSRRLPTPPHPAQLALFDTATASAELAGDVGAPPPASTAPALPGPAPRPSPEFRHPCADRQIHLDDHLVAYALRRARRRSIGFVVAPEGLRVSAPKWVAIGEIEAALRDKRGWILRKLAEQRERQQRLEQARIVWRDGSRIPFLGQPVVVVLDPDAAGSVLETAAHAGCAGTALRVGLPRDAAGEPIRDAVQGWLQRQARRIFAQRIDHYATRMAVRCTRLSLSSAQTRWGSASASGSIRLNWRLIHLPMSAIDYVVVHELAHLREMNHSPRFWAVVRSVLPDYERERDRLKDDVLPVMD